MKIICRKITEFCVAKGIETTKQRIDLTSKLALSKFSEDQVLKALDGLIFKCEFFPDIAKIAREIEESGANISDESNSTASKIIAAISEVGPYEVIRAKEQIGEIGWCVVERFGGWPLLCKVTNDQLPSTRAQLRDLSKSVLSEKKRIDRVGQIENKIPSIENIQLEYSK